MDKESAIQQRICAWCNKVMGEKKADKSGQTHGICPDCMKKHFPKDYEALKKEAATYDSWETDQLMTKQLSEREDYGVGVFPHHDYPENSSDVRPWSTSRNQQELWNRFKEWWREKWYGSTKEKNKVGREKPLSATDRYNPSEEQTGTDGFWEYKQTPYAGTSTSPAFFNAMPMSKEAAYTWNYSPLKGGDTQGRLNWLVPAILDQSRVKQDKWDPSPLTDGDLHILKDYVKKGKKTAEELTREKNYYKDWVSGKWTETDKENIKTEVLERVTAAFQARYGKLPPIEEFKAPVRVGDYVKVIDGQFKNFMGYVVKVDRAVSAAHVSLTLFGVDQVVPLPFKHIQITTKPTTPAAVPSEETREYIFVRQELEKLLNGFQPGNWQAFMYGVSPSGSLWQRMAHMYREYAQFKKRYPTLQELMTTLNISNTSASHLIHTLFERAKTAATSEGALKLRQGLDKVAFDEYANHHVSITFEFMQHELKVVCTWDKEDLPAGLSEEQTIARLIAFLEKRLPIGMAEFKNAKVNDVDIPNRMVGIIVPISRKQ